MPADLDELYQERILDHYEDPFHRGPCPGCTHRYCDRNPLCGDEVQIELALGPKGQVEDLFFDGHGCSISQAATSILLEHMQGKSVDDVKRFSAEDMLKLFGPRLTPNRQKCALLPWRVLQQAVHSPLDESPDAGAPVPSSPPPSPGATSATLDDFDQYGRPASHRQSC